ncbi:MAG TPA: SDR family NAD(P)-dependent oxidoreductase [Ktedonobacteraceae bacterium]|nr:SDR family NAD(P)-dependent oxidoreductase [Ktedonobacteraceae bacterium]
MQAYKRKRALITGASSGIGAAFAHKLAASQYDLVLVARRKERLTSLAAELHQQFHIDAEVLVADLARPSDVERIEQRIGELGDLDLLVNNAGFGTPGTFVEIPLERHLEMMAVHVLASVRLCHAALPGVIARGQGAIINLSSIGAFMPKPGNETYCATKAYLLVFSDTISLFFRHPSASTQRSLSQKRYSHKRGERRLHRTCVCDVRSLSGRREARGDDEHDT